MLYKVPKLFLDSKSNHNENRKYYRAPRQHFKVNYINWYCSFLLRFDGIPRPGVGKHSFSYIKLLFSARLVHRDSFVFFGKLTIFQG